MSTTILHKLAEWADSNPSAVAQRFRKDNSWNPITAREYCDRVYWLALFLESKGVTSKDIGVLLSYNCPEWVHMDLAVALMGAKSAGLYPNSNSKDVAYILNHTQCKVLSVQNKTYFKKLSPGEGKEPTVPAFVELVIVFDGDTSISPKAISYEEAVATGKKLASKKGAKTLKSYLDALDPNEGSFIIYTSGTTGDPKGALITQDNIVYTAKVIANHWKLTMDNGSLFSFLPLCHIAEKIQNIGAGISQHYTVNFVSAFENVGPELAEVQPTLLLCVPRVWEKMMEGVQAKMGKATGVKKHLATWALATGQRISEKKYSGQTLSPVDLVQWKLADRLILSKIRKALGLGNLEAAASGAASLAAHICKWFRSIGVEIMEAFGQTETTGVICLTDRGVDSAGTVGHAPQGVEVKLLEDGEIISRGRTVFKGYYKDEETTKRTVIDGWLYTGDLGEVDSRGLIHIRGRKKDIMKTSGGKMIAPLPIEEALKAAPLISQVCMVGDGRKYVSALITLSEGKLAEVKNSSPGLTINQPAILSEVQKHIDEINSHLASYEQIKRFAVLRKEFSIEAGEMTATLKMKRNVIEQRYQDVINQMYESQAKSV